MALVKLTLLVVLWTTLNGFCQCQRPDDENNLRKVLKEGYNSDVRPSWPTEVHLKYMLRTVNGVDIAHLTFSQIGFFSIVWQDDRLRWKASDYGGISFLYLDWAWKPTFLVVNGVEKFHRYGSSKDISWPMVFSNGTVRWSALLLTTTICNVTSYYFPYDEQTCDVSVAFWDHYYGIDLTLTLDSDVAMRNVYLKNGEWEFRESYLYTKNTTYCCPLSLVGRVEILLRFRRRHEYYVNTLVIPPVLLSVCISFAFLLPADFDKRIGYSLTVLLAYTVFLTMTSGYIPRNSKGFPYIAHHLIVVLVLCTLALLNVVLNIRMFAKKTPPSAAVKRVYTAIRHVVCLKFVPCRKKKYSRSDVTVHVDSELNQSFGNSSEELCKLIKEEPEAEVEITWQQVSAFADTVCFVMYTIVVIVINIELIHTLNDSSNYSQSIQDGVA